MKIRLAIALMASRATAALLQGFGRGGTSLPGKIAIFLCPDLLRLLSREVHVVIVTGTNGKTTTSRILAKILEIAGLSYFENKSGANLLGGVASTFARHATLRKGMPYKYAVIECDEAALKEVSKRMDIRHILVTNLFRDQLDRYGEISNALADIKTGIGHSPHATVSLNADCSLSSTLGQNIGDRAIYFGINRCSSRIADALSDAPYCIHCGCRYEYSYVTYQHLGGYRCPQCGYQRLSPDIYVEEILEMVTHGSRVLLFAGEELREAYIGLPGLYNIYNALAAASAAYTLDIGSDAILAALASFECGFGRMERMNLGGTASTMILVKNPSGYNQVLSFLSGLRIPLDLALILNDRVADGTDISWIWDVSFEILKDFSPRIGKIYVSGTRGEELALRLKYAGVPQEQVEIEKDLGNLLTKLDSPREDLLPLFLLPTYTAMFDLRRKIQKKYKIKSFWK